MSERARTMGGTGNQAYLDGQGGLSDASITQYCNSPTVHIWKWKRDREGGRGKGGDGTDLNHDGWGKVDRNLSGENEWRERDGNRGEDDLEEEFLKEKGRRKRKVVCGRAESWEGGRGEGRLDWEATDCETASERASECGSRLWPSKFIILYYIIILAGITAHPILISGSMHP
jgi:hypothetical protein